MAHIRIVVLTIVAMLVVGCVNESSSSQKKSEATPSVTLSVTSDSVNYGDSVTVNWLSTNANTCSASGAWSGSKNISGSETVNGLVEDSEFILECSGSGGTQASSKKVSVKIPQPTASISASPSSVAYGAKTTLTWSSKHVKECTASGAWSGSVALSGTQTTMGLLADSTFTLTCSGVGGSTSTSALVSVTPPVQSPDAPMVSFSASAMTVDYDGSTMLTWSSTNATTCEASGGWSGVKTTSGSQNLTNLKSTQTYTLSCTGSGGTTSADLNILVLPPPPTVNLSASSTSIAYNGSVKLTWSSSGADSCLAEGSWSGPKGTSGSQDVSGLTATSTYTLGCTGSGGTTKKSVTVSVAAPPAPTLTLSANPTSLAYNGSTTLTWSSSNASSCTASGGWSGTKTLSDSEIVSGLTATKTFTLDCTGAGGAVSRSVTVTVTSGVAGSISGFVDSSRINRNGVNKVYLYAGTVTPDDYDGSGDPIASALVTQNDNACTFSYAFNGIASGTYTLAFTNQAASDVPGQNDPISFAGTTTLNIGSTPVVQNIGAARILTVGPGKMYSKPSLAGAASLDGDVVEIDAGEYVDDPMVWNRNNLTLRGVGGRAQIRGTKRIPDAGNGKGLWVMYGNNVVVENVEFSGAQVTDQNGAGIRADASGLVVCNAYFHDNENGILGGAGEVLIEYSEFNHNGIGGDGMTHNLYMDYAVTRLIFRHNYSHNAHIGHELKSRAQTNYILYNRIMNEGGDGSYTIDLPNAGLSYIVGNVLQQGPNTDNWSMINYGSEQLLPGRTNNLYLVNNSMVNDRGSGNYVFAASGVSVVDVINNIFVGAGTEVSGPAGAITKTTNLNTASPGFVDKSGYDYRLLSTSPAINQGSNPGTLNGYDAQPVYQYLHPAHRQARPSNGTIDIGAYEYAP